MAVTEKPPIYLQPYLTFCECEFDIFTDAALIYCAPGHLSANVGWRYAFIHCPTGHLTSHDARQLPRGSTGH